MAVNLAVRYDKKIAEAFRAESLVDGVLSDEYSFVGAATVAVLTPTTVPLTDYSRTGANRYGAPQEMQDTKQELTMSQDKAFSLTIDKGNLQDQGGVKAAGRMTALEIREQVVPMKDRYTLGRLAAGAGKTVAGPALTKANIAERVSDGTAFLDDSEVPGTDRTLFLSAPAFKLLRLSPEFLGVDALGQKSLQKGQVGEYDGMRVVKVPTSRMPEGVNFIIVQKRAAVAPVKLSETKLHEDPPGISGCLLEGRFRYDCFVIEARKNGVYVDQTTGA